MSKSNVSGLRAFTRIVILHSDVLAARGVLRTVKEAERRLTVGVNRDWAERNSCQRRLKCMLKHGLAHGNV